MPTSRSSSYVHLIDLAKGGLGQVSLVARTEGAFRRVYAMKRLHAHLQDSTSVRRMFVEEARIAGLLRHANVTSVLDVGEDEEGPFLIMDFVDGVSLAEIVRRFSWPDPIPLEVGLAIVAQVARGLHAAHELRQPDGTPMTVVHRDVTPSNILVGFDGVVRVTDFGVAKSFGTSPETTQGVLKGKLAYMPPEQLRFQEVDKRSDLYSLGVVLYEIVAGRRLFKGGSAQNTAQRIIEGRIPDITESRSDLPPPLVELTYELLAHAPEQRPPHAAAVADRLDEIRRDAEMPEDISVERFVTDHFREMRSEREKSIAEALEMTGSGDPLPGVESSFANHGGSARSRAGWTRPRWVGLGLLVLLAATTILVGAIVTHEPRRSPATGLSLPAATLSAAVGEAAEGRDTHRTAAAPPADSAVGEGEAASPEDRASGRAVPASPVPVVEAPRSTRRSRARRRRELRRVNRPVMAPAMNAVSGPSEARDRDWWPR